MDLIDTDTEKPVLKENEEKIRVLINEILDSNPKVIEAFNNGEITAIDVVVEIINNTFDFKIQKDILENIIGEEILTR